MKKGFMFYFGFLLLLLFAGAMVMLVIMLFNPGKSLLGFEYFSYSTELLCTTTTDDSKAELNLGDVKYSNIEINADYANVKVQKGERYKKNSIVVVNNSKGFVKSSDAVDFNYSIIIEEDTLKVSVTEPTGFLFFSKDIEIIVNIATEEVDPFASTNFKVTTKAGNITFGGGADDPYSYDMNVNSLNINTESGIVVFTKRVNYSKEDKRQTFSDLNLNIGSGSFTASTESLKIDNGLNLQTTSGKVNAGNIIVLGNASIKTESGTYKISKFETNLLNVECKNGYFYIDEIVGSVKFPSQDTKMDSPYFSSKKVSGDLTVLSGENLNFNVVEIGGNVNISTTSGSVTIGKDNKGGIAGEASIKTQSGNVSIYIQDANDMAKNIVTESGNIELSFLGQVYENTFVKTDTGFTTINFETGKAYTFFFAYENSTSDFDMTKVKFNDFPNLKFSEGKYAYNESIEQRGTIEIYTNAEVELSLLNIQ